MPDLPTDPIKFAAVVAHQLKSPVSAVSTILKTMLGGFTGPVTAQQKSMLEKAILRCDDAILTSQRLMAISKAMDNPESFDGVCEISKIIRQAKLKFSDKARENDITIESEVEIDPFMVRGYEPGLTEVVEELINNALKYTPDHGTIRVSATVDSHVNMARVSVSDSGPGVPEEDREKVFQPFFRTTAARSSTRPGTGIGLSFVQAMVQAASGNIDLTRSTELGGAKFTVNLPYRGEYKVGQGGDHMKDAMKVIIVGGVAAGPKVAAKICRLDPDAQVTIIERGKLMSYAGCGLPYYISGVVDDQKKLMSTPVGEVRDPVFFQRVKNIRVMNQTEAVDVDRENKRVKVSEAFSGKTEWYDYDKLVLATGAEPVIPDISGINLGNVFTLHGVSDAEGIKSRLEQKSARDVVIVGGGLIGIEITEALAQRGCRVTIVELKDQILPMMDWEIARLFERNMESHGVKVLTNTKVEGLEGDGEVKRVVTDKGTLTADMVIIAAGLKPNTSLAVGAGLEIGETGGIKVDKFMKTSDDDIYCAGDCVENVGLITQKPAYIPLGSTANKQGRTVAINICGGSEQFPGVLSTIICKVFDYCIGKTGLTENDARSLGYEVVTVLCPGPDREHFAPGAKTLMLKLIVDKNSRRLLGIQTTGAGNGDKRLDVGVMAITAKMTVDQLAQADLSYSPPFSPVMDNIATASNVARNKLDGLMVGISPMEVHEKLVRKEDVVLLDVRTQPEYRKYRLSGSRLIPLNSLRAQLGELPKDKEIITFCNFSLRGYEAAVILRHAGFEKVSVMDGGLTMWPYDLI